LTRWLDRWNLRFPPFDEFPLTYNRRSEFSAIFTHTQLAKRVDELLVDACSSMRGCSHLVIGGYGSGKSTLLNYIAFRLTHMRNYGKPFLPVYAGLERPTSVGNAGECEYLLNKDVIKRFREEPNLAPRLKILHNIQNEILDEILSNQERTASLFTKVIDELHRYNRIAFLLDEIDKVGIAREALGENIALAYFSGTQFKNQELWSKGDITFFTAHIGWNILNQPALSFMTSRIIIEQWTLPQVRDLLEKRWTYVSGKPIVPMTSVFSDDALDFLYFSAGGTFPREALRVANLALRYAATRGLSSISAETIREALADEKDRVFRSKILEHVITTIRTSKTHKEILSKIVKVLAEDRRRKHVLASLFFAKEKCIVCNRSEEATVKLLDKYDNDYSSLEKELNYLQSQDLAKRSTADRPTGRQVAYYLTNSSYAFLDLVHEAVRKYAIPPQRRENETDDQYDNGKMENNVFEFCETLDHMAFAETAVELPIEKLSCPACGKALIYDTKLQVWYCPVCRRQPPKHVKV
jgi:hypothetical protein